MPRPWAASNRGRTRSLHYELGHKTGWFDQRLRVNGALFYTDYRSYQTFHLSPFGATIANAERAHALGAEMEASVRLLTELELFASANYTRAEFDRYQFQGNNFDGKPINNIPAYTVTAGIDYRAKWGGLARLSWRRVGEFEFDETNTVGQSAHDLLDVRVGYVWKNFGLFVFGRNMLDREYFSNAYRFFGALVGTPGAPQRVGIELTGYF